MPEEDDWRGRRLAVTHAEARTVLDAQREVLADIDDRAMWTVRVTVILLGIVVTTVNVVGPSAFHSGLLGVALAALATSIASGVTTYTESNLYLGPSSQYVRQLVADDFDGTTWERDLLHTTGAWIDENAVVVRRNGRLLLLAQALLLAGVVALVFSLAF